LLFQAGEPGHLIEPPCGDCYACLVYNLDMGCGNIDSRLNRCLIAVIAVEEPPFALDFPDLDGTIFSQRFAPELRGVRLQLLDHGIHGSQEDFGLGASF